MIRLRLYIDEDAMDGGLVRGLRSHGIDVVTAFDEGMVRRMDEEHLSFATAQGRAIYSFNVGVSRDPHGLDDPGPKSMRDHSRPAAALFDR